MSGITRPWGATGQVLLYRTPTRSGTVDEVLLAGRLLGLVRAPEDATGWVAQVTGRGQWVTRFALESQWHAVTWVLRRSGRAGVNVWLAERPLVYRVRVHPIDEHGNASHVVDPELWSVGFSPAGSPRTAADAWARAELARKDAA